MERDVPAVDIGRGENDVRLDESPADETGMMARTFGSLAARIMPGTA